MRDDPKQKNRAALDLLKKNFPATAAAQDKNAASKSKKTLNPVLALRLLKQRAKPADPKRSDLALERRLYINVRTPDDTQGTPLWIDRVSFTAPERLSAKTEGWWLLRIRAQAKHLMCWLYDCRFLIPTRLYCRTIHKCVMTLSFFADRGTDWEPSTASSDCGFGRATRS